MLAVLFVAGSALFLGQSVLPKNKTNTIKPLTWEDCLKLSGAKVLQSYPAVCVAPDGRRVTQPTEKGVGVGVVEGQVSFVGTPCNPQYPFKVPPCDGPYPNYEVVLYKQDKKTVAGKTISDQEGNYKLALPSGTYYVLLKSLGNMVRELPIVVKAGETTQQNIKIDTGIR